MNVNALNRGFKDRFERNAAFDLYAFYPEYVDSYVYNRGIDGHIVETTGEKLSHGLIRRFVRNILDDPDLYSDISSVYTQQLPSNKVYEEEITTKKIVVRHMRGSWTTASSMREINVFFQNPLFGSTTADVAHNFYMSWVGGYQRNRVYYGDLIVPVARDRKGASVRNDSILPVHIVRGITTPNSINCSGLLLEDWLEYRREYRSNEWIETGRSLSFVDSYAIIDGESDPTRFRFIYTDPDTLEDVVLYFVLDASDPDPDVDTIPRIVTTNVVPGGAFDQKIEEYDPCDEVANQNEY